ncbi:histidinol-phosphatase [Erysipelotrichaceae bacterium OPF54]|nr:histidinol-phosphatase [Erysipelotrichaceae bacterium OPF54]
MKQNLHTHTQYCDGKDTVEEMVLEAISRNFDSIGFSGHGTNYPYDPCSMDEQRTDLYMRDIYAANEQYQDRIRVYLGIEEDSIGQRFSHEDFEYIIGSVHFLIHNGEAAPIDYSQARFEQILTDWYDSDILKMAKAYYDAVKEMVSRPEVDIVGHIDLIAKYNENEKYFRFEDPAYLAMAKDAAETAIANNKIIEMNTGAIARGYRTKPYPHIALLKHIHECGGKICISSDCHNRANLDLGFEQCVELARLAGFTEITMLGDEGFYPVPIEEAGC